MNKVILIGRLCNEVEVRRTNSGKAVASYRLAVDRRIKRDGQPEADFLNCVAFDKNGEFAGKYLHKGTKIAVEGSIQTRDYLNKDGNKVYVTEIIVDRHEFCDSKNSNAESNTGTGFSNSPSPAENFAELIDDNSELPF